MTTIHEQHGYPCREAYLQCLHDDYGIDLETITALAEVLGENEDFDGLVSALEEMV